MIYYLLSVMFLACNSYASSHMAFSDGWEDVVYIEDEFDTFAESYDLTPVGRNPDEVTAQFVLDILASPLISLQDKLQQNFYLFTNPINIRSLLDLPPFLLSGCPCSPDWHLNIWYFYNQTSEGNYTKNGRNIASYLNLSDDFLIEDIQQLGIGIDLPTLFDLIGVMRIQERRTGLMFGACKAVKNWCLEWKTPIYYLEHNFHLTQEEERLVKEALLFDDDNSNETTDQEFRKHVVSDQIGIGDTRLYASHRVFERDRVMVDLGGGLTLPTAVAFSKGLMGSDFKKTNTLPAFNFLELFRLVLCFNQVDAALETLRQFGEAFFDKLAANLLQTSLGNGGHVGLIAYVYNEATLSERFFMTNRLAVEYLLPNTEKRLFLTKKDPAAFAALEPYTTSEGANPAQAPFKLAFLNEQLFNTFFPDFFDTMIFPGCIIKFSTALNGLFGRNWEFRLGYDFWWQSRENFGKITTNEIPESMLNVSIAHRPSAYQNKIFGTIYYDRSARHFDWRLGLYADYTVMSSGIGQDFLIALKASFDL